MAQETRKIDRYTVRAGDSLERLAYQFMGDANLWLQLAILNKLSYPYISDDPTLPRMVAATGEVTFTRVFGTTGDITIPAGYLVSVPATAHAPQKDYTVNAVTTLLSGDSTVLAPITAARVGDIGNAAGLTVTLLGSPVPTNLASVVNLEPITGGILLTIKFPGDTLLVYTEPSSLTDTVGVNTDQLASGDFFAGLLGVDLALNAAGDLFPDAAGAPAAAAGIDNFKAALQRRLDTPLAWYYYHQSYGSGVPRAVGQRGESYWLQFVRLEAERTFRSDPRVQDVQNIRASFAAGAVTLSLDVFTIGAKDPLNLVVGLRVPGA